MGRFAEGIEHVNHFSRALEVHHGLPAARVGISAQKHGGILSHQVNEHLNPARRFGQILLDSWSGGLFFAALGCRGRRHNGRARSLRGAWTFLLAALFAHRFVADFALVVEEAAVYDTKRFVLF